MSHSRWRLYSAAIATIALAITTMGAGPATAAVPSPPTSVTARAGDQLAEVTWTAPTPDDPTITGYTITAAPADTSPVTVDPIARTATVTRLTNGTAYTFTVTATNPDGPSLPRTPLPLSPPARLPPSPSPWLPSRPAFCTAAPSSWPAASSRPIPPRVSPAKRSPSSDAPREEPAGPRSLR